MIDLATPFWTRLTAAVFAAALLVLTLSPMSAVAWSDFREAVEDPDLRDAALRTLWCSVAAAFIASGVAVPVAYAVSRGRRLRAVVEPLVDVPLAAPPVVIGVCLLLLFRGPLRPLDDAAGVTFDWPAVLLAQTSLATCLATRLLIAVFDAVPNDVDRVARSLGASPTAALRFAVLPACGRGVAAAGLLAWARAFGEFGPVLVFAGVTRGRTEVLSTSIHLELSSGRVGVAAVVSLMMLSVAAVASIVVSRTLLAHE